MKPQTLSKLLKAPLVITIIASFVASIYAAYMNLAGIGWFSPVFFLVILILYFIGATKKGDDKNGRVIPKSF